MATQANSEAENFMKPLTKATCSAHVEGKQCTQYLYTFLLNYEQPLTQQLDMPQLLSYSTEKRETLPSHEVHSSNQKVQKEVQENDRRAKDKMKEYADKKRKARNSNLNTGDTILVRQRKQNKLSTHFDPKPWEVVMKKGTMVTACRDDKYIT